MSCAMDNAYGDFSEFAVRESCPLGRRVSKCFLNPFNTRNQETRDIPFVSLMADPDPCSMRFQIHLDPALEGVVLLFDGLVPRTVVRDIKRDMLSFRR